VGCTIGSKRKVLGERKPVIRGDYDDGDNGGGGGGSSSSSKHRSMKACWGSGGIAPLIL
jgi:hypothetical protein